MSAQHQTQAHEIELSPVGRVRTLRAREGDKRSSSSSGLPDHLQFDGDGSLLEEEGATLNVG